MMEGEESMWTLRFLVWAPGGGESFTEIQNQKEKVVGLGVVGRWL